ncbi:dihydroxyacetone kinase, C-terminal domain [Paenibacillus sp. UNCCL117]|uniref:dihydroxyacetone kinase subunit DhaL n=1 Tax=unclassified Paenibacillus TaxID=185978 RepID=UPI00088538C7|nr:MULTISPECIES: dihydroxyacetone kinase subunit DhaL [unclassified Paenibacillus]SDD12043.1 dihydroxyacetone kinase DhaL subunit [Paenibacillus sp. cl123]SFW33709.1 dihydroxyacetone kinase, C-terminal domain [Paenibacillus sp. UNCCL117]
MNVTIREWKQLFEHIAQRIEEKKDELSELDRAVGDGDHGVTMSLGWQAITEALGVYEGTDCGALCKEMAMTFLNAVGSSVGPLYATAFLRGGAVLQGKAELSEEDVTQFWLAAVRGIQERGKAQLGDKTMLDAWLPAMQALEQARAEGLGLTDGLKAAAAAAETGMQTTANLVSQIGRSSRLGERSAGHIDPGAASACFILGAFTEKWKHLESQDTEGACA